MSKSKHNARSIEPPTIDEARLTAAAPEVIVEQFHDSIMIQEHSYTGITGRDTKFDGCVLRRVDLSATRLRQLGIVNSRIEKSNLSNATWERAAIRRTILVGCRMTGLGLANADLQDLLAIRCRADFIHVSLGRMRRVRFEECKLTEADFSGCQITDATFAGCDLAQADFTQARLERVDLRGSTIDGLKIAPEQMRAITIDVTQAMSLIQALGATIA